MDKHDELALKIMSEEMVDMTSTDAVNFARRLRAEWEKERPSFEVVREGIANAVEDWPNNDYWPATIAEMLRHIGPTPTQQPTESRTEIEARVREECAQLCDKEASFLNEVAQEAGKHMAALIRAGKPSAPNLEQVGELGPASPEDQAVYQRMADNYSEQRNAPFSNCKYTLCDLPGQCKSEGKCHHPNLEQLCDDEGCPHHGTAHVCIDNSEQGKVERDAKRYRFLRQLDADGIQVYYGRDDCSVFGNQLDALIDAAIAAREGE